MKEMKIVFPTNDLKTVEPHFGHCTYFEIFSVRGKEILSYEIYGTPTHEPGVFPKYLGKLNSNVIITGGMGQQAINLFKAQNIEVILGASGNIEDLLKTYLNGFLDSNGIPCAHTHN